MDIWMVKIIFSLFLIAAVCQDLRKKEISIYVLVLFGCMAAAIRVWNGGLVEGGGGAVIGVLLLLAGKATGGGIGYGDGWFFVVSGIFLGFWKNFCLLSYGAFLCGVICMVLFLWGMKGGADVRKRAIPFLPFLAPVWVWMMWL